MNKCAQVATCSSRFDLKTSTFTRDRSYCKHSPVQGEWHKSIYGNGYLHLGLLQLWLVMAHLSVQSTGLSSAYQCNRILLQCALPSKKVLHSSFSFGMLHWKWLILHWFEHNSHSTRNVDGVVNWKVNSRKLSEVQSQRCLHTNEKMTHKHECVLRFALQPPRDSSEVGTVDVPISVCSVRTV